MNNLRRILILISLVVLIYFLYKYQQNSLSNDNETNEDDNNYQERVLEDNIEQETDEISLDDGSQLSLGSLDSDIYKQDSMVDDDSIGGLSDFDQKSEISNIDELFF